MSAEYVGDSDRPFGLMRAIGKIKAPAARVAAFAAGPKEPGDRSREKSAQEMRQTSAQDLVQVQQTLKSRNEARQGGLELWPLPGLAPMTRVRTNFGDVHAIALRKGDRVLLSSGEYKTIVWINRIMLDEHILALKPDCNPIVLAPGSMGAGLPSVEIMVSPRQVICSDGLTKPREAAMLVSRPGIRRFRETGLSYTMFHVGESADIYCEGLFLRFPIET